MTDTLTTALERSAQPKEAKSVLDLIEANAFELAKKLPRGLEFEYFKQAVLSEMRRTPKLYECEPHSMLGAMVWSLQLGLSPGPLGLIYFVPFKREVVPIIGYKGKIELAFRSGQVKKIESNLVREGDEFDFRYGTRGYLDFTPKGAPGEREWECVYACAELKSGGKPFAVLYPEDVERRRAKSPNADHPLSPWQTNRDKMWRKSAVHELATYVPQSPFLFADPGRDEAPAPSFEELPNAGEAVEPPKELEDGCDENGLTLEDGRVLAERLGDELASTADDREFQEGVTVDG